ncbi:MAG: hypothetical protein LBJ79_02465 [Endomicrobium sp.]|jgi:hypothetical protein|nr:hypothetical protein [Endomicrobium sp.]
MNEKLLKEFAVKTGYLDDIEEANHNAVCSTLKLNKPEIDKKLHSGLKLSLLAYNFDCLIGDFS